MKKPGMTRRFGSKVFRLAGTTYTARVASQVLAELRHFGYLARAVKRSDGTYDIYTCKKSRR